LIDTETLLNQAAGGNRLAMEQLLDRHRDRLRRMLLLRMDHRLRNRIDPSDVIQETFVKADQRLPTYLSARPLPFYPWLRQIALDQLIAMHRRHLLADRRSRRREEDLIPALSDESISELATCLVDASADPLARLIWREVQERVRRAIEDLPEKYREVIVLRHLEQLSTEETAQVLDVGISAVKMRHLRAIESLRRSLDEATSEGSSHD
jgi:RNA polymerase sigma-70 factor (ECF subfamily)